MMINDSEIDKWWNKVLREREADGARDAGLGVYSPPYPMDSDDPQDEDENAAYAEGFHKRRHELGAKFQWK